MDPRPHALHDLGEPLALEVHGGDTEAEALVVQPSPPRREASPRTGIDGSGSTPSPDTSTPWPGDGAREGDSGRMDRALENEWVPKTSLALLHLALGEEDAALLWLREARREQDPGSFW